MLQYQIDIRAAKDVGRRKLQRQAEGLTFGFLVRRHERENSYTNASVVANSLLNVELNFDHSDQRDAHNGVHSLSFPVNVPLLGELSLSKLSIIDTIC